MKGVKGLKNSYLFIFLPELNLFIFKQSITMIYFHLKIKLIQKSKQTI